MSVMTIRVVTPDKLVFDGEAERVFARGIDGDFAVLHNHIPMMTPLGVGELRIDMNGESSYIAIDSGIFEVSNNHINILSNDAMMAEDIDVARTKMELERNERQKQNAKTREDLIRSQNFSTKYELVKKESLDKKEGTCLLFLFTKDSFNLIRRIVWLFVNWCG